MEIEEPELSMPPFKSTRSAMDEQVCQHPMQSHRMLAYKDASESGIDMYQLEYLLTLTPAERLKRHDAALTFVLAARKAGIKYYGFDPRSPEASQ
jgi:hypothetical protein